MQRKMQHCVLGEQILQSQAQNLLKITLLFDAMSSSFLRNLGIKPRTYSEEKKCSFASESFSCWSRL